VKEDISNTMILRILLFLSALWIIAYLWSFSILIWTEPTGDSFTRGLNRVAGFFGWQFGAGAVGLAIFLFGRRLPRGGMRWLSWVPVLLGLLPILFVLGLLIYSWTIHWLYPPEYYVPPTGSATIEAPAAATATE